MELVSYLFDDVYCFINFSLTYSELQQLNLKTFWEQFCLWARALEASVNDVTMNCYKEVHMLCMLFPWIPY